MPIFPCDGPDNPLILERAGAALRRGELVAFPTETVYGLGANALDDDAVARIFAAKGRPSFNPLIVHVLDIESAQQLPSSWPDVATELAERFWPGPLSLVLPKNQSVPPRVSAGLETVALRAPAHPVARELLRAAGVPLAAPSANRFTELSPTRASHVLAALGDRVATILDGGACDVGIESTVLDLTTSPPTLLRPGAITRKQIEAIIGTIVDAPAVEGDAPRASPGMVARHYAPRATLRQFNPNEQVHPSPRSGAIVFDAARGSRFAECLVLPHDASGFARSLYDALHSLDAANCDEIWIEPLPHGEEWDGVRDRLARAMQP